MLPLFTRAWWSLALRGVFALLFGLAALFMPSATLAALVLLFGVFALLDGAVAIGALIAGVSVRPWWALLLGGVLSVAAGVVSLAWPGITAVALLYLVAFWSLARGVFHIAAAIQWRKELSGEWLLALDGVISIIFGVVLLLQPGAGMLALLWLLGVFAIIAGVTLIVVGFRLRSVGKRLRAARESLGTGSWRS